jgi:hypothetical protein
MASCYILNPGDTAEKGIQTESVEHLYLTLPAAETGTPTTIDGELVIIGVPVYTRRVAQTAVNRIG